MDLPDNSVTRFLSNPAVLVLMIVAIVVLIVLDIFLAVDDIGGNTWSELLRSGSKWTPVVPWLGGLVMGHWFHPKDRAEPAIGPPGNWQILLVLTLVFAAIGLLTPVPPWVPVPLGAVAGAVLWPVAVRERTLDEIKRDEG